MRCMSRTRPHRELVRWTRIGFIAGFLLIPLAPRAQEPAEESGRERKEGAYALEELVVTESKLPQSQENVTQRIDVIDERQIERTPLAMGNLSDLFRYQPGTFVSVLSRNDAN